MNLIPMACCFTGHRLVKDADRVKLALKETVENMAEDGVSVFICGGALGFDTLAAQAVLDLKGKYPVKLCLYLPCDNQTEGWEMADVDEYERIKALADEIFYVNHGKASASLMKKRNRAMVEASDYCICYLNGEQRSGTAQTVRMAEEKGIEVINLYNNM